LLLIMEVYRSVEQLPPFKNAVVTIGTFDGVHEGHRKIIDHLKQEAETINGETVIITFHPHPRKVVSSAILGIRLINTLDEKIELLAEAGIDDLVIIPFTEAFANQSAEDYIQNFLIKNFHPHTIITGYDHRFGKDRLGDYRLLEKMAPVYNYVLKEIPKHVLDEIAISSTNIREALIHSDIETANKLLGYDFFFEGVVVDGDKLGRKLTHSLCLLCGAIGLISVSWVENKYMLYISMTGVGIAWASILSMPYAMLSGSLPKDKVGIYMGIFNFFIVLPEIIASLGFGWLMKNVLNNDRLAAVKVGGGLMILAAIICFIFIKEKKNEMIDEAEVAKLEILEERSV